MYCDITLMILQVCDGRVIVYVSVYICNPNVEAY